MERGKGTAKRGPKIKALPPPGDFIALGSKSTRPSPTESSEAKLSAVPHKSSHALQLPGASGDRKREASVPATSALALVAKKPKLSPSHSISLIGRPAGIKKDKDLKKGDQWDSIAIDSDPADLLNQVQEAEDNSDDERMEGLLCGAVRHLRTNRAKSETSMYLSLMYMAKTKPNLFVTNNVLEAFCSLLRRDISLNFKAKGNALVSVLAANLLMAAYQEDKHWPDVFVTVYLDDALGERVWVDHDDCKGFVDNIQTAFNTKMPPKSMLLPEFGFKPEVCPSPPTVVADDDDTTESATSTESRDRLDIGVIPRYNHMQDQIEQYVLEIIREQVTRRQPMDNISRNVLRLLACTCGLSEVRLMVVQRLEIWLQNPKLMRPAQELLLSICLNCNQHNQQDVEVISHLIKIRLKTKPLINHYLVCIKELLHQHSENLGTLLKHTIYNELSNSRNPNNMPLLGVMFQFASDQTAKILAEVFQDLLANREDYLRALRPLLREIVRTLRYDMNFSAFCLGLMQERKEAQFRDLDIQIKERMLLSVTDLITLSIFLGITPAVREAASAYARGDKKDIGVLRNYQQMVATIQRDAVWWLQSVVPRMYKPGRQDFIHCLHKVLFMEQAEHYYNKDNWPSENDRLMMLRLASDIPVLEDTLMQVLVIGLSKEHPLNAPDAHELSDQLVKRAAALYMEDFSVIQVERVELINALFNLCAYRHPENITFPLGYKTPNLAISNLYWKSWVMLLIITAHNPSSFGFIVWENYPTLISFIEMCITNHFTFPPPTMATGDKADEMKSKELQISHLEKQGILEFENHLASASTKVTITETNSLLLPQLTSMDPKGIARRPPTSVLEQLKELNQKLKLGHLLCRSRNPDFLLQIIQRQGTSQSMPWLADLVESSEGAFNVLPVQCLCEFLLNEPPEMSKTHVESDKEEGRESKDDSKAGKAERAKKREKQRKQQHLLRHLQSLLHESGDDPLPTSEVLDYFFRRLSSQQSSARFQAIRGLTMVVCPTSRVDEDDDDDMTDKEDGNSHQWLLKYMPLLPHFEIIRQNASIALRQACQIETDPWAVSAYIQFLANYSPDDQLQDLADLALNLAQVIVDRTTVLNYILPADNGPVIEHKTLTLQALMIIFLKYLQKAREPSKAAYSWSESQDQIIVQWAARETATMHILVVHAMVILLTYGPPEDASLFNELLEIWFPSDTDPPQAFLMDTSEEALLLPDWLKLRMIRSNVEVLVDAALRDLEAAQLVLFIQSFGIPVPSVSKLLHALDIAVEYDSYSVESAVVDKGYMSQLVEVQQQRGAIGGESFARLLDDGTLSQSVFFFSTDNAESEYTFETKRLPLVIPPKTQATILPDDVAASVLYLFHLDPGHKPNAKQQMELFRSFQKVISVETHSVEKPVTIKILGLMDQITSSRDRYAFVKALHQFSSLTSPLFRMLHISTHKGTFANPSLSSLLTSVVDRVLGMSTGIQTPLISILNQISSKQKKSLQRDVRKPSQEFKFIPKILTEDSIIKTLEETATTRPSQLEQVVRQLMMQGMKQNTSIPLVSALSKLLLQHSDNRFSLFIDWLELLEPEIINAVPELQQQLLFAAQKKDHKASPECEKKPFRSYLLAVLTHQANWDTLHKCLARILTEQHVQSYDASAVLDFVWACIYIPKIWQGRDKHVPKHYTEENILGLSARQVVCVIDYLLEEAVRVASTSFAIAKASGDKKDEESEMNKTSSVSDEVQKLLGARLPLLVHCCNDFDEILSAVVEHLLAAIDKNNDRSMIAHVLLLKLYLQVPQLITWIDDTAKFLQQSQSTLNSPSKLDAMSQTLLTALATTEAGKDWADKIQDIDLACRKMAACHPTLMLRQLPMLVALLRGRIQLDFPVFKSRHHLYYFNCVLGLLELLQPHLFRKEYNTAVEATFESYFDLIKVHGLHHKELGAIINRFLLLLHTFISTDSQRAIKYIQKHSSTLHDLSSVHPDMQSLRSLLAGISLPCQTADGLEDELVPTLLSFAPTQASPARTQAETTPLLSKLAKGSNMEDVLAALQELESASNRNGDVLEYFVDDLKRLLTDPNESCRNHAHNLVIRYIKQKPKTSSQFLNAFLRCLDNNQQEVIISALERLAEFVILSQENAGLLLRKAFSVGISTSINTLPYISDTLLLLNMQSGS